MKNVKKKLCMALSFAACLCAGFGVAATQFATTEIKPVAAAEVSTPAATEIKMLDGASVRKNKDDHGIRFRTFIGNEVNLEATYGAGYKLGTLFIPANAVGGDATKLTVDADFNGVKPASAEWDGDTEKLTTDEDYTNGKFFNAVLDLSDLTVNKELYLNNKILARSYVKKADGEVVYLGSSSRAPAYVAANAVIKEGDTDETVLDYVSAIAVNEDLAYNVAVGDTLSLENVSNVEGLPVSVNNGDVAEYTATAEGETTLSITILKGTSLEKTGEVKVSALGNKNTFYNNYYTPDGSFEYTAYGVSAVKLGDTTLVKDTDYTYVDNTLLLKKSAVVNGESSVLTVESATGNVEVEAKAILADYTSFNAGQLGLEVMGDLANAENVRVDTTAGAVKFDVKDISKALRIDFNEDYISALFAHPSLMNLSFSVEFSNVNAVSSNLVYSEGKADGSVGNGYTKYTAKRSVDINRAAFNNAKAKGTLSTFGMWILASNLKEGATATLHSIYPIAVDKEIITARNNLYADAQLIGQRGLSYAFPALTNATVGKVQFGNQGTDYVSQSNTKNACAVIPASVINMSVRNAAGLDVTPKGWDRDRVYLTTKAMINDDQYITVDKLQGDTYTYAFGAAENLGEGDKIYRVSLNGKQITTFDENGNITVNKADLEYGHNALEVNVEHTTGTNALTTCCNTYYRSLCAVTQTDWDSALTFEMGINPFISLIGGTAEVIDSSTAISEMGSTYKYATTAPYASGAIQNNKVLKITGSTVANSTTTMYVYSKYYVARRAAAAAAGGTEACQKVAAFGSGYMRWSAATLDGTITDAGDNSGTQPKSMLEKEMENRSIFAGADTIYNAVYDGENVKAGQEYFKIIFASANKTGYFDDIFAATTSNYHASGQNKHSLLGTYDYWNK